MAESKRLAAHRAAASAAKAAPTDDQEIQTPDAPGEDEETPSTVSKPKEKSMDDETKAAVDAARTEGHAAGIKAANERMNAVFASERYAGREAAAAKLLGKAMSAEDIIDVLGDMPKAQAPSGLSEDQQREAAEEGGRKAMKDALAETGNSDIDANGGGGRQQPDAGSVWDKAIAKVFPSQGK